MMDLQIIRLIIFINLPQKDSRINVFVNKGIKGPGRARNFGLKNPIKNSDFFRC